MTTESDAVWLYRIAVQEYQFNVELAHRRMQVFLWPPLIRWGISACSLTFQYGRPNWISFAINAVNFAIGIYSTIVGLALLARGHEYYKASRAAVSRIEARYGFDWVAMWTPSQAAQGPKVTASLRRLLFAYLAVDVLYLVAFGFCTWWPR